MTVRKPWISFPCFRRAVDLFHAIHVMNLVSDGQMSTEMAVIREMTSFEGIYAAYK